LLEAALEVIRREGPGVSMERIAAEAGVTKPILYRHFGAREGIVEALAERFEAELTEALQAAINRDANPRELLLAGIDTYLSVVERDPHVYQVLVGYVGPERAGAQQELMSRVARQVAVVVGEQLRALGLDSGAAEPWAYGLVGMVHAAGDWWLRNPTMPRTRLVEYLAALVWDGMDGYLQRALLGAQEPVRDAAKVER
jgi:AcrR family transcriptional regulator